MPRNRAGRRRVPVLRSLGFVIAVALGVVGVWFVVVGTGGKDVRIGVIAALWGLLLGTFAVFGARVPVGSPPPPPPAPEPPAPPPSRELDLRQIGEIERAAVAAARREFQQELQIMLRREVHDGFARELASLRAEVTALRNDLVEKVGGQLRLERIETTRLIGSDLEAVHSELRKLRETANDDESAGAALPPAIPVASPRAEVHDAEIVAEDTASDDAGAGAAVDVVPGTDTGADAAAEVAAGTGVPVDEAPAGPDAAAGDHGGQRNGHSLAPSDPFANMPRIRPFTDFELDPVPSVPTESEGRHSRRHRADEGGSDVLARILAREQH